MAAWRVFVGFAGAIALLVFAVAAYYAVSLLILTVAGRLIPLAGRRRRRE
jgi:hypothetical protein